MAEFFAFMILAAYLCPPIYALIVTAIFVVAMIAVDFIQPVIAFFAPLFKRAPR